MIRLIPVALAVLLAGACAVRKPPVASYGPPPPVREPAPTAVEELSLLLGEELTRQEAEDLAAIRATVYTPPPDATPPSLDAGLEDLLRQEGAVLIHERVGYDIPIVLNDRVEWWIDYFMRRIPDSFERYMMRSGAWLPYLQQRLREAGLPEDLVYLAMIESGFSSRAVSHAGAVGPWQFMPYTGREYGLRIDRWVDERMDYERATGAAIAYLSDLHAMFGSWYLAAAGYNGGQGRVGRSMLRDNTINFWELTGLHDETKNYVPKLIAATIIAKEPERYGFRDLFYLQPIEWDVVTVPTSTDFEVIAAAAGTSVDMIRMLNPHLLQGRTPPGEGNFPVKIPGGRAQGFSENYFRVPPSERVSVPATHLVRRGETIVTIAGAYGVDRDELMRLNGLGGERDLQDGMSLSLPGGGSPQATSVAGGNGAEDRAPEPRIHVVTRGQTLSSIARQHGVTVEDLRRENDLRTDTIRLGQRLRIPGY
ncbi:MAG TPA: LysM peptidoglycan-binding domain-containing protein [Gemmatimonadota bacterium]|nr:LysM peptidoglycan-binding domain-containing protein [Gemmatimonadota bacterium]